MGLPGYTINEKISETMQSTVFKGIRESDNLKIIIKVLKTEFSTPAERARFKQEYDIIRSLDYYGIIKTLDVIYSTSMEIALILEDFDGISLKDHLKTNSFALREFLEYAIRISETIGYLHKNNIVHKDIKPGNILINTVKKIIKLTDFGIASELTHDKTAIYDTEIIEGTLVYMSPEQTGRINRFIDYRTDFYSLGITFYEILTGLPPFTSADPMEMIHSHIARKPIEPCEINANIPKTISDIIMKLISKPAENRYQSGYGLAYDFRKCLFLLNESGTIPVFTPGENDISLKFNIPQHVFGRETEINALISSFDAVAHNEIKKTTTLVKGNAGIGKSSVILEIQNHILANHGFFISGKYDQYRRDVPYSAFIQAFQKMAEYILSESNDKVLAWKNIIQKAVGNNGKIITDLIPKIELIIGPQGEVPLLGSEESANRFNILFRRFLGVFASHEHPLVIFLDDLHWADSSSLRFLISILSDPDIENIFFIGAFRETDEGAPLVEATIETIRKSGCAIDEINLTPLNFEGVYSLISNFLKNEHPVTRDLSNCIHEKTNGNPFFVIQFLKSLYENGTIEFIPPESASDGRAGNWKWDIEYIRSMHVSDNVVQMLANNIDKLPEETIKTLQICACIGNHFELSIISAIYNHSLDDTLKALTVAIVNKLVAFDKGTYRFLHDRIQQAIYSLIPEESKTKIHYLTGTYVLESTSENLLPTKILFIVDHLNAGISLITNVTERVRLASLNLAAATRARLSAAYESAWVYSTTGITLVNWHTNYNLALSLFNEAVESAYLSSRYEEMEILAKEILSNTINLLDNVTVYETILATRMAQNRPLEAITEGIRFLKKLGVSLPDNPRKAHIVAALLRSKISLIGKNPETLLNLSEMTNPQILAATRIFSGISSAAYYASPNLVPIIAIETLLLSIKYGNGPESALGYATYGLILCTLGQIDEGYQFGMMALDLLEKTNQKKIGPRITSIIHMFITPWKNILSEYSENMHNCYLSTLDVGDFEYAANNAMVYLFIRMNMNITLPDLSLEMEKMTRVITQTRQEKQLCTINLFQQWAANMVTNKNEIWCLDGPFYDEKTILPVLQKGGDRQGLFSLYYTKFTLALICNDYDAAYKNLIFAKKDLEAVQGIYQYYIFSYYDSVIRILYNESKNTINATLLRRIRQNIKALKRLSKNAPFYYKDKLLFIQAEYARITNDFESAIILYDQAIACAKKTDFVLEEAFFCEYAGRFWLSRNKEDFAKQYINRAYLLYKNHGASVKTIYMETQYQKLITGTYSKTQSSSLTRTDTFNTGSQFNSGKNTSEVLDISTALKASQTISGEIILPCLLEKMISILLLNAGAEKACLILETEGKLTIEAKGHADNRESSVLTSEAVETSSEVPSSIINYTARTGESILLNNAVSDKGYSTDPYIKKNSVKSVLCLPVKNQGRLSAILYLENNLTENAFLPDRVGLLEILSSQAAVSIDNARLYSDLAKKNEELKKYQEGLEHLVEERTRELNASFIKLQSLNDQLENLSITDGLTGIFNRRHLDKLLQSEWHRLAREKQSVCILMIDIDHFKKFNDEKGHQAGDEVLRLTAATITAQIRRPADFACRYGGEEFTVVLPCTDSNGGMIMAEKIRLAVSQKSEGLGTPLTISIGLASIIPSAAMTAETLIEQADSALYCAKKSGRNRTEQFKPLLFDNIPNHTECHYNSGQSH